jgi:hypothetical protein
MGEYADMILDGYLCEWCGVTIENNLAGEGFPQLCPDCAKEGKKEGFEITSVAPNVFQNTTPITPINLNNTPRTTKKEKITCSVCNKKISPIGLNQHMTAKH